MSTEEFDPRVSEVSIDAVRAALDDLEDKTIAESTIARALGAAETYIASIDVLPSASDEAIAEATIALAAYKAFSSSPAETRKEAAGVSKSVAAEAHMEDLREEADNALEVITSDFFSITLNT